jgi:hypothetical protein
MCKTILQLIAAACLLILHSAVLAAPGDLLFSDDFERATLAPNWSADNAARAGINADTASSPTRSMYTRHQVVTVTSSVINLTVPGAEISYWIRRGRDDFSENPDAGEDLIVEYLDSVGTWMNLVTYTGSGTTGQIYTDTIVLPFAALHANFQLRVRQTGGSGVDFDYWHIDDIVITEKAVTRPPLTLGSCDDFEQGMSNWNITSAGGDAGINTATSQSPTSSMFTNGGVVSVTSNDINTNNAQFSGVSMWIRRGADSFSEDPDGGEDFVVEYLNNALNWVNLDTFNGNGAAGQIFTRNYNLPASARHSGFQLRFRQTGGNAGQFDFWHVDDVCINGTVPFPTLVVSKSVAIEDDPVNATNPKAIPLSNSVYSIRVSNTGIGSPDSNTLVISDDIPAGVEMFTGNFSGGAPYTFTDGAGADASGVSCNFVSLASTTDCITFYDAFSNPITPNGSYDPSVRSIEFRPSGTMNPSNGPTTPYFDIDFRIRVISP